MLSSSIRRAVRTTSSTVPFPTVLLPTAIVGGGSSSSASAQNGSFWEEHRRRAQHQRRYSSSSKPPVPPNDGSRPIDTSSSSQAPAKSGVNSAKQKREGGGKNSKDEHGRKVSAKSRQASSSSSSSSSSSFLNLPSVPSTQDTPMQDIHLASFFSFHRPISVSTSVPPTSNDDAFNAIFEPKSMSKRGRADVLNTLTSVVQSMEHAYAGQDDLRHAVTQASDSHAESGIIHLDEVSEEELHTSIAEFARRLTPFRPPAAPQPYNAEDLVTEENTSADAVTEGVRMYSTVLTIRETAHADGQRTFETFVAPLERQQQQDMEAPGSSGAIIDEDPSRNTNTSSYIERTINNTMYAISVRRQRKLKMKKHKFKKLLRRTRTLRRKLDKA